MKLNFKVNSKIFSLIFVQCILFSFLCQPVSAMEEAIKIVKLDRDATFFEQNYPSSIKSKEDKPKSKVSIVPSSEERKELQESIQAYMDYRFNRQKQLTEWAKDRVSSLKEKLNKLELRATHLKAESSQNWKTEILPKLRAQKELLNKRLKQLKEGSKDIWIQVKWAFGEALETYEVNLNKALDKIIEAEKEISKPKPDS